MLMLYFLYVGYNVSLFKSLSLVIYTFVVVFSRGTHGYMAPEVLQKGQAYDSSADWFSFGCMLFKLLKGLVVK